MSFVSVILGTEEVKMSRSLRVMSIIEDYGSSPLIFDVFAKFRAVCEG